MGNQEWIIDYAGKLQDKIPFRRCTRGKIG
jgi:hypothetical protein